jgi:sugar phosphate isomerase/epimerase
MFLSFASNAFKRNSLDEAITAIAEAGYGGVELMADMHHAYPPSFSAERRRETRKRLGDLGMVVSNVNAFTGFSCGGEVAGDTYHPTWIESEPDGRRRRVEHTLRCIELAAEFGCGTVSLQPGGPLIGTGLDRESARERFAEGVAECAVAARAMGVVLAVEPEPGLLIQTSAEYMGWKSRYFRDERAVRMNCDLGHLFCVGEDLPTTLRACRDEIAHVHLEDIGANRVHQHLTPGNGVIDFAAVFSTLREIEYPGRVTVELYPYEATAAEVAKLAMRRLTRVRGELGAH